MECKYKRYERGRFRGVELIDTLWNVNQSYSSGQAGRSDRINRYIMECKYTKEPLLMIITTELIDTLWNVN